MGEPNEVRPGRGGFHEHPSACICGSSEVAAHSNHDIQTNLGNRNLKSNVSRSAGETIDNHSSYEDFDRIDLDDGENTLYIEVPPVGWNQSTMSSSDERI